MNSTQVKNCVFFYQKDLFFKFFLFLAADLLEKFRVFKYPNGTVAGKTHCLDCERDTELYYDPTYDDLTMQKKAIKESHFDAETYIDSEKGFGFDPNLENDIGEAESQADPEPSRKKRAVVSFPINLYNLSHVKPNTHKNLLPPIFQMVKERHGVQPDYRAMGDQSKTSSGRKGKNYGSYYDRSGNRRSNRRRNEKQGRGSKTERWRRRQRLNKLFKNPYAKIPMFFG